MGGGGNRVKRKLYTKLKVTEFLPHTQYFGHHIYLIEQNSYFNTRGFYGSVNIPESCDFRSQFDPLNIIF